MARFFGISSLVLLIAGIAFASEPVEIVSSEQVVNSRVGGKNASSETVAVIGQPFTSALRVTTTEASEHFYSVQVTANSTQAVRKGDVCLVSLYARTVSSGFETGEGQVAFFYQKGGEPYTKSLYMLYRIPQEWTQFYVPFKMADDYIAGKSTLGLGFGAAKQAIEVADVKVLNYGRDYDMEKLPRSIITYSGREPEAPWRKEAAERIEKQRKANILVAVVDASGKPVRDAKVQVSMTRHAYRFGTAVHAWRWSEQSPTGERYREEILKNFNTIIVENSMKWQAVEGDYGPGAKERALELLKWAKKNGLNTHGHVLVWPSVNFTPKKFKHLVSKENASELAATIKRHIEDTTKYFDPYVDEWQVVNEMFGNRGYVEVLGDQAPIEWFRTAHASIPNVPLYINDNNITTNYMNEKAPQPQFYKEVIRHLQAAKAPLAGIGFQGHIGNSLTPPPRLYTILEEFAQFGLPLQATEFDVHLRDEEVQGDYVRDYITVFFSHPSTAGLTHWGFWEGQHWVPFSALVRKDWSYKPSMLAYRDLVFNQWWTDVGGKTDQTGKFTTRGFLGDYKVTVEHMGKSLTQTMSLTKKNAKITVTLK